MPTKDGGIGYKRHPPPDGRARHEHRHAVDIAIKLLGKYGYFSEGRTYTIADPNEASAAGHSSGQSWVARRVQDNEIIYIPNNFMMDKVDATDTKNVIVAPGMIEHRHQERSLQARQGRRLQRLQLPRCRRSTRERHSADYNSSRNNLTWNKIIGKNITDPEQFPYSAVATKKWTVDDVKDLLRTHEHDIQEQDARGRIRTASASAAPQRISPKCSK